MANFGKLLLTNLGINEQYKAQGGEALKFKRIAMGSGKFTGNIMALTKLVSEQVSVDISKGYKQNNAYVVEGFFSNEGLQTGFAWREIGLFVEDKYGKEILYSYANAGDSYDYIPATADERYSKYIRIATAVGNATNISIVESEGILYVDTMTFNTAVEEFRTDIDQLWPSKIASGESILIKDSAAVPFLGMKLFGKSEQIKTTGAQMLSSLLGAMSAKSAGVTWTCVDGVVHAKGTTTGTSSTAGTIEHSILGEVGTFFISGSSDKIFVYCSVTKDDNTVWYKNAAFTLDGTETQALVYMQVFSSGVTVDETVYPMLNEGNVALPWEPYTGGAPSPSPDYPQDIVSPENITVNVYGKNLLDDTKLTCHPEFVDLYSSALATTKYRVEKGKTYTLSFDTENTGKFMYLNPTCGFNYSQFYMDGKRHSFTKTMQSTVETNGVNMALVSLCETSDVACGNISNVQLEYGSEATDYVPFSEQTVAIPRTVPGVPVNTGGNYMDENGQRWVRDEVDLARGVHIQRCGYFVYNGSEDEEWMGIYNHDAKKYVYIVVPRGSIQYTTPLLCNYAKMGAWSSDNVCFIHNYKEFVIGGAALESVLTSVATFKEHLASNPIKLAYVLETPVETPLTDAEIEAYKALTAHNPYTTILNNSGAETEVEYVTKSHEAIFKGVLAQGMESDGESESGNVASIDVVRSGSVVSITTTMEDGSTHTDAITLDSNDYPKSIISPGKMISVTWEGFDDV